MVPAVIDAKRIAIFEPLISAGLVAKARFVMKIDIVKPIPPSRPAPKMFPVQVERQSAEAECDDDETRQCNAERFADDEARHDAEFIVIRESLE